MQKEKITFEQIMQMDLPNIILYAAPVMFVLVGLEWFFSYRKKQGFYDAKDTLAATTIGLVNVGISALIKVVTFGILLRSQLPSRVML